MTGFGRFQPFISNRVTCLSGTTPVIPAGDLMSLLSEETGYSKVCVDRWIQTGDTTVKKRILDYNEDDCVATRVVLDGIRAL